MATSSTRCESTGLACRSIPIPSATCLITHFRVAPTIASTHIRTMPLPRWVELQLSKLVEKARSRVRVGEVLSLAHEVFDIAHDCALKKGRFEAGDLPDRIEVGVRQIRTLASRSGLCAFLHAQRTWPPFPSARFGIGFNAKKPINASASASICSILACWRDNQREHSQPAPSPGDPPRWRQRLETRSRGRLYRSFPRRFHVNLA